VIDLLATDGWATYTVDPGWTLEQLNLDKHSTLLRPPGPWRRSKPKEAR
jgi:hypothetical protein